MARLTGKVALVTGASSGIGAALAREFARQGAAVALLARRADRIEALAAELTAAGGRALAIPCDVTSDGDLERATAAAVAEFGRLDIVVANAGFGVAGRFADLALDDYRRQFETNVFGVLRTASATLAELSRTGGTLAIVGSVAGYLSAPGSSPYAMSKAAVRAFAVALRGELAPRGVAVVLVTPGFVDSEIRRVDNRGVLHPGAREPVPAWLRMPAATAARKIAGAIVRRRRELVVTAHGKVAVLLARHTPGFLAWLVARARVSRPEPGRTPRPGAPPT
ncbi:MAG: SDR family NAD(P)-dependent oxidoreductase [Thermoanaerobaculaceae bacterium]|nr:SDR family NAD(P)-dependent oxidoreductase [Thermoanaerobaculaceae bacterium]TAM56744.1 MAG: SDR family NAD(P)-dependent oxidoreductase [Acidobacteriota bacterium]